MNLSGKTNDNNTLTDYKMGSNLDPQQQERIHQLFHHFQHILALNFTDIKGTCKFKHDIDTADHPPIKQRPYRAPVHYQEWIHQEIETQLASGIIIRSNSPWASPIVLVPKKTGSGEFEPHMCVDYRKLNKITKGNAYPIPHIQAILDGMKGKPCFFTSLDMFMGYNQFGLTKNAMEKSAFVTEDGHFEFTQMPFGLCGAPATFQSVMNEIFEDMIGKTLYVYIDDITIYTRTFEQHMEILQEVFHCLSTHRLFLKPKKCTVAAPSIELLGHVID